MQSLTVFEYFGRRLLVLRRALDLPYNSFGIVEGCEAQSATNAFLPSGQAQARRFGNNAQAARVSPVLYLHACAISNTIRP
jgi:hypothetical protein